MINVLLKGVKWRSSVWFATLMVGMGITGDLLVYSIVIPVLPFRLEDLGYKHVSSRVGWLVFAYSAGLVLSTLPIAWFSENYSMRRTPMILGLMALLGSQVMLMEAPAYWVMCLARIIQGISSSVVWVVGLALLCDTVPENILGRQLGIAMSGFAVGLVVGPPVGGVLYGRLGYRAPYIFVLIFTGVEFILRFVFVERKDALKLGVDPTTGTLADVGEAHEKTTETEQVRSEELPGTEDEQRSTEETAKLAQVSLLRVLCRLCRSSRALVALFLTLAYGLSYTILEPTIPLHLQERWDFNSSKVGIVLLASILPTVFSSPISGWITDHHGPEWLTFISLAVSLPWWAILIIPKGISSFVSAFAIMSFLVSAIVPPVTAELAAVSRTMKGVGYAHVYGAFNIAYGVGTALGPVIGGQVYAATRHGWKAICFISLGTLIVCMLLAFFFVGERPLSKRLADRWSHKSVRMRPDRERPLSGAVDG